VTRPSPFTGTVSKNANDSVIGRSTNTPMLRPSIVTASDSGLRRWPLQSEHGTASM